jgi:hypothetical protein
MDAGDVRVKVVAPVVVNVWILYKPLVVIVPPVAEIVVPPPPIVYIVENEETDVRRNPAVDSAFAPCSMAMPVLGRIGEYTA